MPRTTTNASRDARHAERVLRTNAVADLVGVTRTTLWRWTKNGHFPPSRIIGPTKARPVHGWLESDVSRWLRDRPEAGE